MRTQKKTVPALHLQVKLFGPSMHVEGPFLQLYAFPSFTHIIGLCLQSACSAIKIKNTSVTVYYTVVIIHLAIATTETNRANTSAYSRIHKTVCSDCISKVVVSLGPQTNATCKYPQRSHSVLHFYMGYQRRKYPEIPLSCLRF